MQFDRKAAAGTAPESGAAAKAAERQRFVRFANAMPLIVWISDPAGRTEYLNDHWYEFSGIERTSAGCESWLAAVHPDDERACHEAWNAAIQSGLPFEMECRFGGRSNGTHHWFLGRAAPSHSGDGTVLCWVGTATDINEVKRATEIRALNLDLEKREAGRTAELFESEQRLRLMVESVWDTAIYMLDCNGRVETWNIGAERLKGYTAAEIVGRHFSIFYRDEDVRNGLPQRELAIALEKGQFHEEGQQIRKDGSVFWASILITPVYGPTGELRGFSKIAQDVTPLKKAIEAAREACERAENANRAKSDFLARMSHEIRTPMNLILGMNALLLEGNLDARQRKHVEISYRNVRRLLRLINTILDLSKVEAGKLTLEVAPFDLNDVFDESVATLSAAVEQKGLRLSLDVGAGIWPYRLGDPERLQQVLINLLGNAAKFTAEGSIHLRARPVEGEADGESLRFEVCDTGCGIPKGQEEMIFEAFQQVDGATNRTYEGTGLGLSITKSLVELMGGRIWVEPKEGPGAQLVFTACLPRATKDVVTSHLEKSRTVAKVRGLKPGTRILIAEDNEENLFLLQSYLKGQSAIVEIAANGVEAVQKRQENQYDVILMDIQMPLMDGLAATRVIRTWEAAHESVRMPIVALTAHALSGAAAECQEAGCDGYLSKPVQRADLVQTIIRFSIREVRPDTAGSEVQSKSLPEDPAIRALRPRYLANRGNDIKAMRAALETRDFSTIKRIAHDSKGTGTGYGFPEISALGKALENAAIQSDAAAVAAGIAEMEEIVSGPLYSGIKTD